jgi:hypothetical protein
MKRFLFWFVVVLVAIALVRSHRRPEFVRPGVIYRSVGPDGRVIGARHPEVLHRINGPDGQSTGARRFLVLEQNGQRIITVDDSGVAVTESSSKLDTLDDRDSFREVRIPDRVFVDDLPVPVVPGSRVTEAQTSTPKPPVPPRPPAPPRQPRARVQRGQPPSPPRPPAAAATPTPIELTSVKGRISATEQRAHDDARARLESKLREWLEPDVPKAWKVPVPLVDGLVREVRVTPVAAPSDPVARDYGPMYEAEMRVDLSNPRRAEIVEAYRHEQTLKRLGVLGALFAFVLVCLAVISGYIRADEATKGYYTNRLRLAAAVGAGAAGVAVYRWLA